MKGVQQALDLNLVRALMLMSCSKEAVERFGRLEASGGVPLYMHQPPSIVTHPSAIDIKHLLKAVLMSCDGT